MLLDYLVTSKARRNVLRVLARERRERSVRRLAREAGVGYASAHAEVNRLRRLGLVSIRREGAAALCRWKATHPGARLVKELLENDAAGAARDDESRSDVDVVRNLKRWGAPLVRPGSPSRPLALEETVARALVVARRDATVAQVLPVVLAKHRSTLDLSKLEKRARNLGQKRALGFFLEVCARFLKDRALADRAERLRDRRVHRMEDFFTEATGPRARALAERATPLLAREWRFRMNMPMKSFEAAFRKFVRAA